MQLNHAQLQAVKHVKGPMMVIAGPGSGKTAVLTHRIQNLILQEFIKPNQILVITFTRAAADEMEDRFLKLMEKDQTEVTFGTFHSVFYAILREYMKVPLRLIEMKEAEQLVLEYVIEKLNCDRSEAQWRAFFILSEYSRMLNNGTYDKKRIHEIIGRSFFEDAVWYYREKKREMQCIDYDDMLIQLKEMFAVNQDILKACRQRFQYILVDEFQDINSVQFDILCQITEPERNLFVVGDDDQAIYSFRGSQPEYLLEFPERFRDSKRVDLILNYRCRKEIVDAALKLISKNQNRFRKELSSAAPGKGEVRICQVESEVREAIRVCDRIKEYAAEIPYEDIAVLYRTHAQCRILKEQMLVWDIPFQSKEHVNDPIQSEMVKDIQAYIRIAEGMGNQSDMLAIWKKPERGLPEYLQNDGLRMQDRRIGGNTLVAYEELDYHLHRIHKLKLTTSILYIWNQIGYKQYVRQKCEENGTPWSIIEKHFRWIVTIADKIQDRQEFLRYTMKDDKHGVQLMTMHGAKGLEFTAVLIIDANEGICPYEYAKSVEAIEEERRIFYVAMTRAIKHLDIFSTKKGIRRQKPSRFLSEIET